MLHPTCIKLRVTFLHFSLVKPIPGEITAYVTVPVGDTHQCVVLRRRDMVAQSLPCGLHVSTPCVGTEPLLTDKSGTCQYYDALILVLLFLIFVFSSIDSAVSGISNAGYISISPLYLSGFAVAASEETNAP